MSDGKNSFVVHTDIKEVLDDLTDAEVGSLFRGMVDYQITGKSPSFNGSLKFIFIPIRQQMDRDTEKWNKTKAVRTESGRQGGIKSGAVRRAKAEANEANASKDKLTDNIINEANEANEAVTVTVPVTVTDSVTVNATTTVTDTVQRGGSSSDDDEFNLWKLMSQAETKQIQRVYPNSWEYLIDEVSADVTAKRKQVRNKIAYILGYAKNKRWDDDADHFTAPWES